MVPPFRSGSNNTTPNTNINLSDDDYDVVVVDVGPGDALYIPAFWFHEVEALSPASMSLNIWTPTPEVDALQALWDVQLPYSATSVKNPNLMLPLTALLAINFVYSLDHNAGTNLYSLTFFLLGSVAQF